MRGAAVHNYNPKQTPEWDLLLLKVNKSFLFYCFMFIKMFYKISDLTALAWAGLSLRLIWQDWLLDEQSYYGNRLAREILIR